MKINVQIVQQQMHELQPTDLHLHLHAQLQQHALPNDHLQGLIHTDK